MWKGWSGARKSPWAQQIQRLVDEDYPAQRIVLVVDNLNTHAPASLYEAFEPAEARRIAERLEIHYTPKHGSWLNRAEIEITAMVVAPCLNRRLPATTPYAVQLMLGGSAAIPASCGKAVPGSFEWPPLDVIHPLGSFRTLGRRDQATFWLRRSAEFCVDQSMPGSHVDGSRRGACDQERGKRCTTADGNQDRVVQNRGRVPHRRGLRTTVPSCGGPGSQTAPRIFSHGDAYLPCRR